MQNISRALLALGLGTLLLPAQAAFHLWDITEVYSNADGTVQYIELFTTSTGQDLLSGKTMVADSGGAQVSISFTNLPNSSTANRYMLLATPAFANQPGGIQPDYEIPAAFFDPTAASITLDFAPGTAGTDEYTFSSGTLPTDGTLSLDRATETAVAPTPTNFAGETGEPSPLPLFSDSFEVFSCAGRGGDCLTLAFNASPEPPAGEIYSSGTVRRVDVYLLTDRSGSMATELAAVENNLATIADNLRCPPGGNGAPGQCIEDLWFGGGGIGYAGTGGESYTHQSDLQPSVATVAAAIDSTEPAGGCCNEVTRVSLAAVATGASSGTIGCTVNDSFAARSDCSASPAGAGGFGYGCFRPDALSVVTVFTDEPDGLDCPSISATGMSLSNRFVFFTAINSEGSGSTAARSELVNLASASDSLDRSGQQVVLEAEGTGVANALQSAVTSAALDRALDVEARLVDDPGDAVDVNSAFLERIEVLTPGTTLCPASHSAIDTNADGFEDTFLSILHGAPLCFRIVLRTNTTVAATGEAQLFPAQLEVYVDTSLSERRPLTFVVPPQ